MDLLRLTAVVLVLFNHATYTADLFPAPIAEALQLLRRGGWVGVDLFFVLSGYLVSGLLFSEHQRHGRAKIGTFLIRRSFKIYPAFWALLAYTCISIFRRGAEFAPRDFFGELLFLQNYLGQLWGHTWSLAVEEHFYIGLAILIGLAQRRSRVNPFTVIPYAFVVIALLCLALRLMEAQRNPTFAWYEHMTPTHLRADSLFFGVLLSYGVRYHSLQERLRALPPWVVFVLGCLLLLPAFILDRDDHRWLTVTGYNLFYVASGLLLLAVTRMSFGSGLLVRLLAGLGAASYSIYLWHGPVATWSSRLTKHTGAGEEFLYLFVYIGASLAGGYVMSRLIEIPALRFRDRYFKSRSGPLVTPGAISPAISAACIKLSAASEGGHRSD
jgi:peptidoglycan/LPS O-acetylase OafA/YrhL